MNLRFVEAFHGAAALKSVTRAAEKLFVTRSALYCRIGSLERPYPARTARPCFGLLVLAVMLIDLFPQVVPWLPGWM